MMRLIKYSCLFFSFSVFSQINFDPLVIKTNASSNQSEVSAAFSDGYLYYYKSKKNSSLNNPVYSLYKSSIDNDSIFNKTEVLDKKLISNGFSGQISFDYKRDLLYLTKRKFTEEEVAVNDIKFNPEQIAIYKKDNEEYKFHEEFLYNDSLDFLGYPCFSKLTNRLYFSSKRDDGKGGYDIYYSEIGDDNKYGEIKTLGGQINNEGDQFAACINHGVLYFISFNSEKYKSDFDIYYVTELGIEAGESSKILPSPLNSSGDDFGIDFIDDRRGYLTSNRDSYPIKNNDIYYFDLGEPVISEDQFNLLLEFEKEKKDKLTESNFKILNKKTNEELAKIIVTNGVIIEKVREGTVYEVWFDESLNFENFQIGPYSKMVRDEVFKEEKVEIKERINTEKEESDNMFVSHSDHLNLLNINSIIFDFNSYTLKAKYFDELNKIVLNKELFKNEVLVIEGHTDDIGDQGYNKSLSLSRAKAVKEYLIIKGYDKNKLKIKGYAASKIIDSKNKGMNRRVEISFEKNTNP